MMNWTFRLGRVMGIDVYVHWMLPAWILFRTLPHARSGLGPVWLLLLVLVQLSLFGIVLLHELGHCAAGRRHGLDVHHIILWPLGGIAMIGGGMESPSTELKVAIAGPLVNLALALPAAILLAILGEPIHPFRAHFASPWIILLNEFLAINVMILLFNLIPCFPMDGGRILRSLLSFRMGRIRASLLTAKIAMGLCFAMGLFGLLQGDFFLVILAGFIFFQARQEYNAYATAQASYGPGAEVYWRGQRIVMGPPSGTPQKPSGPTWFERQKARRAMKRWLRENERKDRIKASTDDILDKMNRVGFDGLTAEEQRILKEASQITRDEDAQT